MAGLENILNKIIKDAEEKAQLIIKEAEEKKTSIIEKLRKPTKKRRTLKLLIYISIMPTLGIYLTLQKNLKLTYL